MNGRYEKPRGGVVKGDREGIDIREQINQGFVRSELGTAADTKAERIYSAAEVDPVLLKRHAGTAVNNYVAAVSCFLRALPTVKDVRSKKLIQEHVNKLLKRLGWMRELLKEAERLYGLNGGLPVRLSESDRLNNLDNYDPNTFRDEFDDDLLAAFDALMKDDGDYEPPPEPEYDTTNLFPVGTKVEILSPGNTWDDGEIIGYNKDKYNIRYKNGIEEEFVDPNRVRLPVPKPIRFSAEDAPRMEVMSEILESERQYNLDLYNLDTFFIHKLKNPAHWGGEKEKDESWFTQKTLNDEEAKKVFANIEEIINMNRDFLSSMEQNFSQMETDQSLASVFVKYAPKFKLYVEYVVQYEESQKLIAKMKKERMGFQSADEAAERQKIAPLSSLMSKPVERTKQYIELLHKLKQRTPSGHPSLIDIDKAIVIFNQVNAYVQQARNMKENQKYIRTIENRFKPAIGLVTKSRIYLYDGELNRMEDRNSKTRKFWLFNDILVAARPSEWLARGAYRHLGTLHIKSYGDSEDYGPLSFYVKGNDHQTWHLICPNQHVKDKWFSKLAQCSGVNKGASRKQSITGTDFSATRKYSLETNQMKQQSQFVQQQQQQQQQQPPPPPPPPPRALPPGWVELVDQNTDKIYYFNQAQNITQWEKPT